MGLFEQKISDQLYLAADQQPFRGAAALVIQTPDRTMPTDISLEQALAKAQWGGIIVFAQQPIDSEKLPKFVADVSSLMSGRNLRAIVWLEDVTQIARETSRILYITNQTPPATSNPSVTDRTA